MLRKKGTAEGNDSNFSVTRIGGDGTVALAIESGAAVGRCVAAIDGDLEGAASAAGAEEGHKQEGDKREFGTSHVVLCMVRVKRPIGGGGKARRNSAVASRVNEQAEPWKDKASVHGSLESGRKLG